MIKYLVQFSSVRNVTLNGEAYFDVTKNPESPFVIDAGNIKIKVLGTSFNVVSYKNDSLSEVVVAEGRVEVTAKDQRFKEVLLPSERLALNTVRNTYSKSTVDIQNYISWKTGKLIFMNDRLDEVIQKLSRFYNVDFDVKENVNKNQLFRAILEDESLDEILRYMKLTMGIDYTIQERKIDQDNRLSKQKIIITKAKTE
jgi:ferric-dicitrate binding protein FerR (iron transport regulator)